MFGIKDLKRKIEITKTTIECPVEKCKTKVKRMRKEDLKKLDSYLVNPKKTYEEKQYFNNCLCKKHRIYITPSTFIYQDYGDNLLWKERRDKKVFDKMLKVKRVKAQLYHDNSEDAVSWNVFRFFERNNLIDGFLSLLVGTGLKSSEVIYWSYSQKEDNTWSELKETRDEFGEEKQRGSEPDIIIKTDKALFFIEAKLTSANKIDFNRTHTAKDKEERASRYRKGDRFLKLPFRDIIDADYYELGRFWVIGCSIAEKLKKDFYLVNIVLPRKENDIKRDFGKYIDSNQRRKFLRLAWEDIYQCISKGSLATNKEIMLEFFRTKTIGYKNQKLQKAFSIQ